MNPIEDFIARERRQPGVTERRVRGAAASAATVVTSAPGGAGPGTQQAELTAGTRITPGRAYGFFTDTTICIGCKACEVACKQWNQLPAEPQQLTGLSYDNTKSFSATTWRHVRFIEQMEPGRFDGAGAAGAEAGGRPGAAIRRPERRSREDVARRGGAPTRRSAPASNQSVEALRANLPAEFEPWGNFTGSEQWADPASRWLLMSDVCKHCVNAPCLEACPTGSIIRTEFDSVYVQQDVCNGCGYCQSACPFGVVEVDKRGDGKAHKCTLCYDRLKDGLEPACAKACPTESIRFGPVDELLERARERVAELRARGIPAYLYGSGEVLEDHCDTSELGGLNCFFLLVDRPEVYNLPPVARRPSGHTPKGLLTGLLTAAALTATTMLAFHSGRDG